MTPQFQAPVLETKYCALGKDLALKDCEIEGYASLFGAADQGGDIVQKGAYVRSLGARRQPVRMLWQHDPARPIGVWTDIREDGKGLYVKGRILADVQDGREALALLEAGAIDGLSIGYRTVQAERAAAGGRKLIEIDLWEVSVVTFPMLPEARVQSGEEPGDALAQDLAEAFAAARAMLA
ncbi:MAG: HK97 family phage prohead protease [Pseudomonadota bacterium]